MQHRARSTGIIAARHHRPCMGHAGERRDTRNRDTCHEAHAHAPSFQTSPPWHARTPSVALPHNAQPPTLVASTEQQCSAASPDPRVRWRAVRGHASAKSEPRRLWLDGLLSSAFFVGRLRAARRLRRPLRRRRKPSTCAPVSDWLCRLRAERCGREPRVSTGTIGACFAASA